MPYTLQYSIKVNCDTITGGKLVHDAKYMSTTQENSCWYLKTEFGSIYTTVYHKKTLVPKFNIKVITNTPQLKRYVST